VIVPLTAITYISPDTGCQDRCETGAGIEEFIPDEASRLTCLFSRFRGRVSLSFVA
jgi:hypothetical protein